MAGKGLLAGRTTAANKDKDKKRPVSRSSRAVLQLSADEYVGDKSPNSVARRRVANADIQRKGNDLVEQRRNSPTQSPKIQNSRKLGLDRNTSRSPRNKRPTSEISSKERTDDTISESSRSSSSQMDLEFAASHFITVAGVGRVVVEIAVSRAGSGRVYDMGDDD